MSIKRPIPATPPPCAVGYGPVCGVSPQGGTEEKSPWWKGSVKQVNFTISAKECGNYE